MGTLLEGLTICDVVDAYRRNSVSANVFWGICIFISDEIGLVSQTGGIHLKHHQVD